MAGSESRAVDAFDLPDEPTIADLLRWFGRQLRLSLRTHVPASVVAYNPATHRATVMVQQLQVVRITDSARLPLNIGGPPQGVPPNATAPLQPLILKDVPVAIYQTKRGRVTIPIDPGDEGELHVSDRSLSAWLLTGKPVDPQLAFTHALQDSVFHPGLHSVPNALAPTDQTATVVDGQALVKIGAAAIDFLAKAQPLISALDAFANATPVANDGGLAIQTAFKTAWLTAKPLVATVKAQGE